MRNMEDNTKLDNEVADLTDALLSGGDRQTSLDLQGLDKVARQLNQMISPAVGPDPAFRARLTQRLMQEWDATQGGHASRSRVRSPSTRRFMRYAALAAVLIVVLGLVLILGQGTGPVVGTA